MTKLKPFWTPLAGLDKSVTSNFSAQLVMARAADVQLVKVQVTWCLTGAAFLLKQISSKIP